MADELEDADDDQVDAQYLPIISYMQRVFRSAAVRSLLVGNDVGCFTVEQYAEAYIKVTDKAFKVPLPDGWSHFTWAEEHLRSLPDLVTEVRPGVWRAVDQG